MTWLMTVREHAGELEAEPVLVEREGGNVVLVLDDGDRITVDRHELLAAINLPSNQLREAAA